MDPERPVTLLFRWDGTYWGFRLQNQLHDRYGRHVGWIETTPGQPADVYHLTGRFLGELIEGHYVMRSLLRAEPVHRAERAAVPVWTPPDQPPDLEPKDPRDGWTDALPWPLRPPEPPRL